MPLYEYKCHSCGKTFEVIQKFSEDPLKTHPECGGSVERVLSAPAFHLKGSGWYATDYAKGSGTSLPKPGDSKDDTKGDKAGGSESKGESGSSDKKASESKGESSSSSATESKPATPAASSESK